MFLNVPFVADLNSLRERRQLILDENLRRQNSKRCHFDYNIGDQVHIKAVNPAKLDSRSHGPHNVTRVHANGALTAQRTTHVRERINLRRVFPHRVQR